LVDFRGDRPWLVEKITQFQIQNCIIIALLERFYKTGPPGQSPRGIAFSAAGFIISNYMPGKENRHLLILGHRRDHSQEYDSRENCLFY